MKDSEILKMARELIAAEQEDYICHALEGIGRGTPEYLAQTKSLQRWVLSMFNWQCTSFATWLHLQGIYIEDDECENGPIRDTRLRWLDWMIQYCELEEAGWTPLLGGETPPETCSAVMFRDGLTVANPVYRIRWTHAGNHTDIIAYKP